MKKLSCHQQLQDYQAKRQKLDELTVQTESALSEGKLLDALTLAKRRERLALELMKTRIRDDVTKIVVLAQKVASQENMPSLKKAHEDILNAEERLKQGVEAGRDAATNAAAKLEDALNDLNEELAQSQEMLSRVNDMTPEEIEKEAQRIKSLAKSPPVELAEYLKEIHTDHKRRK